MFHDTLLSPPQYLADLAVSSLKLPEIRVADGSR